MTDVFTSITWHAEQAGDPVTDTAINDELQGDEKPEDTIEEEDVPLVKSDPVPEETE